MNRSSIQANCTQVLYSYYSDPLDKGHKYSELKSFLHLLNNKHTIHFSIITNCSKAQKRLFRQQDPRKTNPKFMDRQIRCSSTRLGGCNFVSSTQISETTGQPFPSGLQQWPTNTDSTTTSSLERRTISRKPVMYFTEPHTMSLNSQRQPLGWLLSLLGFR